MLKLVLIGVVLPVAVCAGFLVAAWRPWRGDQMPDRGGWGGAVGYAACFMLGFLAVEGWRVGFPPAETWHWLAWLALLGMVIGIVDSVAAWPWWLRLVGWLGLSAAAGWLLVPTWQQPPWVWRLLTATSVLALLTGVEPFTARTPGASGPLALAASFGGASGILMRSGNAKLAQLAGALAAALAATTLLSWWRPSISLARGPVAVLALLLPGLLLTGYFLTWSEIPAWVFVLAALAPLAVWAGDIPPLDKLRPWQLAVARVAAASVPAGIALGAAIARTPAE